MTSPAPHRHTCPECGRNIGTGFGGVRLMPHKRQVFGQRTPDGLRRRSEPCPGSRTLVAEPPGAETGA